MRVRCSSFLLLLTLVGYLLMAPNVASANAPAMHLTASTETSQEGFLTLAWSGVGSEPAVSLELALDQAFTKMARTVPLNSQVLEKGQVHISGLQDGEYSARLVSESYAAQSNVIAFRVQHRDLSTALWIFALGAILFVALVAMVFRFSIEEN